MSLLLWILLPLLVLFIGIILWWTWHKTTYYETLFPEEAFALMFSDDYPSMEEMKRWSTVSILLLIPIYMGNGERLRRRIQYLMQGCSRWKLYLYGLDSPDHTLVTLLRRWEQEDPEHVALVEPIPQSELPRERITRIAAIRSRLQSLAKQDHDSLGLQFVMMYDGDLLGPVRKQGLIRAVQLLSSQSELLAVAAAGFYRILPGIDILYDPYAFRNLGNKQDRRCFWQFWRQLRPELIRVKSAYNGACIYRWEEMQQVSYASSMPGPAGVMEGTICEHVVLHRQLLARFPCRTHMCILQSFSLYSGLSQPHIEEL